MHAQDLLTSTRGMPNKVRSKNILQQRAGTCPALRFSFFPPQSLSAEACSARPYEKLSTHGLRARTRPRLTPHVKRSPFTPDNTCAAKQKLSTAASAQLSRTCQQCRTLGCKGALGRGQLVHGVQSRRRRLLALQAPQCSQCEAGAEHDRKRAGRKLLRISLSMGMDHSFKDKDVQHARTGECCHAQR